MILVSIVGIFVLTYDDPNKSAIRSCPEDVIWKGDSLNQNMTDARKWGYPVRQYNLLESFDV